MNRERVKAQLRIDEGKSLTVYLDSRGHLTVGVGHLVRYGEHLRRGDTITVDKQESLLDNDLDWALLTCYRLVPEFLTLHEEAQEVLVNLAFNLGYTKLAKFTRTLAAFGRSAYQEAADGLQKSLWYSQVGDRSKRLVARLRAIPA